MQVEAGIPLHICLSRFSRWLQNLQLEMGVAFANKDQRCSGPSQKRCTFLTWSGKSSQYIGLHICKLSIAMNWHWWTTGVSIVFLN